ncbi:Nucleoside-specific channel-forming protein tsx precursor [Pragia fontium]|uniref:nucleoside-specific channel-forming protein Tsx n=1 Tax=Pragia fontium TaxID=82985 RepID=UPI00064A9CC4|nr:nucleoside-specific channel-forming protein Tsx [Pragia fontium]AKJ42327.1 nucleoside-specific channel-forming protein Tsx [Pragia fontium]SUB82615.1 Nucleoside-specific channel-forming protein tsx precursor [Pragia fontium]
MQSIIKIFCTILAMGSIHQSSANETHQSIYLSDWWHQSINIVGSYNTRFGPIKNNDLYLEYEAYAKTDLIDFYGYIDVPKTFGVGNTTDIGIWDNGSPIFMEIEPRFSLSGITNSALKVGPFKDFYFANNYIFDMGKNSAARQSTWYMGLGTDIDTGLPFSLAANVYAKYQWQNYGAQNENSWDGYRFKIKYFAPISRVLGGDLAYIGYTNFDWGSDLGDKSGNSLNGKRVRSNNAIASSHILALNYDRLHYAVVARYFHNGGQWKDGTELNFGNGNFSTETTGWGYYLIAGYNF